MDEEIWKPCPSANNMLEVSNLGRVRSVDRVSQVYGRLKNGKMQGAFTQKRPGRLLSPCITKSGYLECAFMVDGVRKKLAVHRLVGFAFVDGYFEGASIDHINGNKTDNRKENLEWVTLSENTRRQWASGLVDLRGELAAGSKITNTQAHAVKMLADHGFMVSEIAEWFGISTSLIYKIKHGKRHL